MHCVWSHGPSTADAVRTALHSVHPLKDSSVRTLLRRLEAQGYLQHRTDGKTFVYVPRMSRHRAVATGVRQIIDRLCGGSVEQFLAGMVDEQVLSSVQAEVFGPRLDSQSQTEKRKDRKKQKKRKKRDKRRLF